MLTRSFRRLCQPVWIPCLIALGLFVLNVPSMHAETSGEQKLLKLQSRAERGDLSCELELAGRYLNGDGLPKDAGLAAQWYEKAAQSGNGDAQNQIGYLYQAGIGVPVDLSRAFHWYQLATASGSSVGKLNLALLYTMGLGVPKDIPFAMQLFEEGARKGDGTSAAYLGQMYYFGLAGSRDVVAAEKWLQVGAKLHDPVASYNLGALYSKAADHPHDFARAAELLRFSAGSGYTPAMHSLGLLLVNHPELKQTPREAVTWLEQAMNAGQWKSSILLGILARDGKGIPVDTKSAIYHFQIAALQGGEEAEHQIRPEINRLSRGINGDECVALAAAAQAWYLQHHTAQPFIARDPAAIKFFPLSTNPTLIDIAALPK